MRLARTKTSAAERAQQAAAVIAAAENGEQHVGYLARFAAQVALPYREPAPGTGVWVRRDGDVLLTVTPGGPSPTPARKRRSASPTARCRGYCWRGCPPRAQRDAGIRLLVAKRWDMRWQHIGDPTKRPCSGSKVELSRDFFNHPTPCRWT
ncbi:hypothetical protein [Actinokineospora fastidiosa]|uniref:Uncharacterized protein n=1 Tax=Actinokineospora fastidiosa TaxID=1816 RepID=A0A918GBL1_9PSEU|nr:hypothetical protein [Actinokineospora fastidiosa]GGS28767.1 hypothetical protein GCM10010171_22380 [Actinokineospora fastidiosa]